MSGGIRSADFDIRTFSSTSNTFVVPYSDRFWCETGAEAGARSLSALMNVASVTTRKSKEPLRDMARLIARVSAAESLLHLFRFSIPRHEHRRQRLQPPRPVDSSRLGDVVERKVHEAKFHMLREDLVPVSAAARSGGELLHDRFARRLVAGERGSQIARRLLERFWRARSHPPTYRRRWRCRDLRRATRPPLCSAGGRPA